MPLDALAGRVVTVAALRRWWQRPAAPLLVIAAVKLAVHLATDGVYGFQRDEMYYILSGQHPALGYVDYPPVTPMLAWVNTTIFGISPWTLRLFPALAGAAVVFLAGMCAREMGGGRGVSMLASVVTLMSPLLLGANWLFQTVTFDQLTWLIALYLVLRILRTGDQRLFIWLGVDVGVGLETKLTVVALCVGIVIAAALSPDLRAMLRTRPPWIGVAVAIALAAPNFAWQAANGLPTLTYITNHSADISQSGGIGMFIGNFLLFIGPLMLPLFVVGMVLLFRDSRRRPIGVLVLVVIALLLPEGKAYYPAPIVPMVLAAGCVGVGRIVSDRRRRWVTALVVAGGAVQMAALLPFALPVVPQSSLHSTGLDTVRTDYADTVGWPELAAQVAAVYTSLPASQRAGAAILAGNYGEAAAIDIYDRGGGIPPALSPELTFWYWKPSHVTATTLVIVNIATADVRRLCGTVRQARTVIIPDSVSNQEQGQPILICSNMRETLDAAWPSLRNFS